MSNQVTKTRSETATELCKNLKAKIGDVVVGASFQAARDNIPPAYVIYVKRDLTAAEQAQVPADAPFPPPLNKLPVIVLNVRGRCTAG